MKIFERLEDWLRYRRSPESAGTLGFVPTMGALHAGHRSLVERSVRENSRTLVSIFVNPTQFDDPSDLERYPKTFESDRELLESAGADFLLCPDARSLYADGYRYRVSESELSRELCGAFRPGHFDGVLTVVLKLLSLAGADRAYFGEKDFQQLELVRGMANAFFLPTEIVGCPTVRDDDGLALSSRNMKLSPAERALARELPRVLRSAPDAEAAWGSLLGLGFQVDYVVDRDGRRFAAVRVGNTRLIDNVRR